MKAHAIARDIKSLRKNVLGLHALECPLRHLLKDILSTSKVFKDFIKIVFGLMMRIEVEVV